MLTRFEEDPATGCHLWLSRKSDKGYALVMWAGKLVRVTRLLWTIYRGAIPVGWMILHTCDNTSCVNLDHLYCGTHANNVRDAVERNRYARPRGSKNPAAKLTDDDVRAIRKSSDKGVDLAARYSLAPGTISKIRSGKLWSHVR